MQGYITLALGPRKYLEMAANLAASLKVMDPRRQVAVVHDAGVSVPRDLAQYFDFRLELPPDPLYPDVMNKLRLFGVSPFEQTMFIDADCLLVKMDVDHYWHKATKNSFP